MYGVEFRKLKIKVRHLSSSSSHHSNHYPCMTAFFSRQPCFLSSFPQSSSHALSLQTLHSSSQPRRLSTVSQRPCLSSCTAWPLSRPSPSHWSRASPRRGSPSSSKRSSCSQTAISTPNSTRFSSQSPWRMSPSPHSHITPHQNKISS